jgi:MFS family permease
MLRGWLEIARNRSALVVSFVQASQYYCFGVIEFYLVQYMTLVAGFNALEVSVVMGVQIVSLIVSRPLLGRVSDRYRRRIPIVFGCILSGVLLFLIPFTAEFVVLLIISIGYGLGFAMVVSSTAPLMVEVTSSSLVGTSMGFLSTVMDVGQVLGPIISGIILATALAYLGLFWSLTVLLAAAAVVFFVSGIGKKEPTAQNQQN